MRSKTKKSREWMSVFAVFVILGAYAVRSSVGPAMLSVQAATSGALIPQSGWSLLSVDSQETVCGNYAAVNSFDGNTATFWHTQFCPTTPGTPHDIQINLGATYNISGFTYLPRQDGCSHGWISQYQFYVSADGVNWGNAVSSGTLNYGSAVTGCPGASVPPAIQVLFPSTSAHYVQLRALSEITGGPYISMAELNLVAGSSTAALSSLALNPTTVTAGTTSQGTVVLSAAAPSSGAVITLSSSNTAAATAPASVSVAAGATSGTFTVSTGSVSVPASSTISASYSGLTVTAPLTVNPAPIVSSLAVNPTSVVGGNSALGTVTLSTAAPASGAVVNLTTSNPVAAAVPANVSIAGGATTASFTVSTSPVASTTAVTSSASYGGATATATLSVQAGAVGTNTPIPQSGWSLLSVDSQETTCGNYAAVNSFDGKPATFWHTQFCPTTPGVPHYIEINLGATYNISGFTYLPRQDGCSHGWISQYQFYVSADGVNWGSAVSSGTLNYGSAVTGCPGASVPPAIQVLFPSTSAHYVQLRALSEVTGGPYTSMAELNVLSNSGAAQSQSSTPAVTALTLNPIGVAGGATSQGKVTLSSAAPSSGIVVTLASSNTAAATVPTSVSIASGTTSATFTVSTSSVSASTSSTISATYAGATMTAPLAVSPAVVAPTITTEPGSETVTAGQAATFSVVASGTAPLTYQWQENGTNISGATSASYTTPATTTTSNGSIFQVVVSNSAGSITSSAATLTVNSLGSTATIDATTSYQTITGFGAATAFQCGSEDSNGECNGNGNPWTTQELNLLYDQNLGIGLSLIRFKIEENGSFPYNTNIQNAIAKGAQAWGTPWSPPPAMKTNGSIDNGGSLETSSYQAWAAQLVNYLAALKNTYGIPVYAISVQNEPDFVASYESAQYSAQQFHDFVLNNLCPTLQSVGLGNVKIMIAEESTWAFDLATTTQNDSAANACIGIYAAHGYNVPSPTPFTVAAGQQLWETEDSDLGAQDTSASNGLAWAQTVHNYLTVANVNAWHYWWAVDSVDTTGQGLLNDQGGTLVIPARFYMIGQFTKFIRPGYVRIGATVSPIANTYISAYQNPANRSQVVIVALNQGSTNANVTFQFNGFTASSVTPYVSNGTMNLAAQSAVSSTNGSFTYSLLPYSVTTFVGQ
jgi:O-glycosyl hydrolase